MSKIDKIVDTIKTVLFIPFMIVIVMFFGWCMGGYKKHEDTSKEMFKDNGEE